MKKIVLFLGFFLSFTSSASLITVDTTQWSAEKSPRGISGAKWDVGTDNDVSQSRHSYGAFVSDFTTSGDFYFSGFMTPKIHHYVNSRGENMSYNDNDILGVVFGWENNYNHYRLGWEQGGLNDKSKASGLFLVKEVAGVSNILFQQEISWQDDMEYNFVVERSNDDISFTLNDISQSYTDTSFMSGHVGVYVEGQIAAFGDFATAPSISTIPEPSTFAIFALGVIGLVSRRFNK